MTDRISALRNSYSPLPRLTSVISLSDNDRGFSTTIEAFTNADRKRIDVLQKARRGQSFNNQHPSISCSYRKYRNIDDVLWYFLREECAELYAYRRTVFLRAGARAEATSECWMFSVPQSSCESEAIIQISMQDFQSSIWIIHHTQSPKLLWE